MHINIFQYFSYFKNKSSYLNEKAFYQPTDLLTHFCSFSKRKKRLFESQQVWWRVFT